MIAERVALVTALRASVVELRQYLKTLMIAYLFESVFDESQNHLVSVRCKALTAKGRIVAGVAKLFGPAKERGGVRRLHVDVLIVDWHVQGTQLAVAIRYPWADIIVKVDKTGLLYVVRVVAAGFCRVRIPGFPGTIFGP